MVRALVVAIALIAIGVPALAQPQPDSATLQRAVAAYRSLLLQANDKTADAEMRVMISAEENAKLQAQIKELQAKLPKAETDQK